MCTQEAAARRTGQGRGDEMDSRGVPFLDLQPMQEEVRAEVEAGWRELIARSAFVGGAAVSDFERDFAGYCGVPHCVGVASGTDALRIALQAVGVAPGDLVVTVPHTFIATVEGITQAGAAPLFLDIDPAPYGMALGEGARHLARGLARRGRRRLGRPRGPAGSW